MSFMVAKGDDGNTTIIATGSGFDVMPIRNGQMIIPVYCSFETADGAEYEFEGVNLTSTTVVYSFKTSATPVLVSFYAQDNQDEKHTFPVD